MNIKKCSKCGWEYPASWPHVQCKFCHTRFRMGYCNRCGEWSDNLNQTTGRCPACCTEEHAKWRFNRRASADKSYNEWLEQIKAIPTPYKTLTEAEWLESCTHFSGCAFCGDDDIQARQMFVPFRDGGRYCAWNIVPACERCATARKDMLNPFRKMDSTLLRYADCAAKKRNYSLDKLQKIVDYLQTKLEVSN